MALTLEERLELRNRMRATDNLRAPIILERARGGRVEEVARKLSINVTCVSKWLGGRERCSGPRAERLLSEEKVDRF